MGRAAVDVNGLSGGVVIEDIDRDGNLDIIASAWGLRDQLRYFHNEGDGRFTDRTAQAGLIGEVGGLNLIHADYDNDGRLDLYLSRMEQQNVLYRNEGPSAQGWRFTDVTEKAGVAEPSNSFPTWFFDFDNDGWLDLFVAPFPGFSGDSLPDVAADYLDLESTIERPRLYHNEGDGTFRERSREAGLDDVMLAMGANYGDLDNDGLLDIYVGTGEPNLRTLVPNRMYRNTADGRFRNVTFAGGFGHLQKGHGIGFGDLDNDGDQDIYAVMGGAYIGDVAYNALFLNPGHPGHRWIALDLEGVESNRSAIGARLGVTVRDGNAQREIHVVVGTGGSFGSSSLRQEIGLGRGDAIVEVRIAWPSGKVQRFTGLKPGRAYRVREGEDSAIPVTNRR